MQVWSLAHRKEVYGAKGVPLESDLPHVTAIAFLPAPRSRRRQARRRWPASTAKLEVGV